MSNQISPLVKDIVLSNPNGSLTTYPTGIFGVLPRINNLNPATKTLTLELALVSVATGIQVELLTTVAVTAEGRNTGNPTNSNAINKEVAKRDALIAEMKAAEILEVEARTELKRINNLPVVDNALADAQREIIQAQGKIQRVNREKLETLIIPDPTYDKDWKFDDVAGYFTALAINDAGIIAIGKLPYNGKTIKNYI